MPCCPSVAGMVLPPWAEEQKKYISERTDVEKLNGETGLRVAIEQQRVQCYVQVGEGGGAPLRPKNMGAKYRQDCCFRHETWMWDVHIQRRNAERRRKGATRHTPKESRECDATGYDSYEDGGRPEDKMNLSLRHFERDGNRRDKRVGEPGKDHDCGGCWSCVAPPARYCVP